MNSTEIPDAVKIQLSSILKEFNDELQILYSQNVLTQPDIQKIRNQAEVSRDGMLETLNESVFDDHARKKLLDALVRDFQTSIQRIIETAVARKGEAALVLYKLNKADKGIVARMRNMNMNSEIEQQVSVAMHVTKAYILKTLPIASGIFGRKPDIERIITDYSSVFMSYLEDDQFDRSLSSIRPTNHE